MNEKVALVTGAGTGIGKGIALELAKAGYAVAIHYNSSLEGAKQTKAAIEQNGGRAELIQADLNSQVGHKALFEKFDQLFDRLDAYVNNAGVQRTAPFLEVTHELFDNVCNVNWRSCYFGVAEAGRRMAEKGIRGSIVLIGSNHQFVTFPDDSVYGVFGEAVHKFTRHAAIEFARYQIRVNCIAPGWTHNDKPGREEQFYEASLERIPLGRWVTPEQIGKQTVFFCSDKASFITGACLVADGGAMCFGKKQTPKEKEEQMKTLQTLLERT